jgi:site-specific recombinase XerD
MTQALNVIADIAAPDCDLDSLPWSALRYEHTQAIRARLAETYSAATANKALSALRRVLRAAWRLGLMTADQFMAAADVGAVKGERAEQAAGRALSLGELMALVASCSDGTPAGVRDAALLGVAYGGGLRRAEIAKLTLADVRFDGDAAILTVCGKRNKERAVPIRNGALAALRDWLAVRGDAAGALFWPVLKGGRLVNQHMTSQAIYLLMRKRSRRANVAAFSPHDMRRTFAGDLLDAGADISTVQRLMGHASTSTTAGYDRRGERAKRDAAGRLHYPYQGVSDSGNRNSHKQSGTV